MPKLLEEIGLFCFKQGAVPTISATSDGYSALGVFKRRHTLSSSNKSAILEALVAANSWCLKPCYAPLKRQLL
jgi:hypothetical protein